MGVVVKCDAALFLPCTAGIQAFTTDDETKQGSPVLICNRAVFPRYDCFLFITDTAPCILYLLSIHAVNSAA
ncbi:unnamed protein product [Fusarium fujikuroi]|uniref:Uncharacterized protein n=1 Tax=Fusarium fujikuroi TaxID=5127 RepID=A0A9Q9U799_FUSFU|nr:unnamed protein product [Fusarium fujikuroi]VZH91077.1 unnamed protein product [Fusarium fujikuroi]